MKCPRQKAFVLQLDELLSLYYESMRERFSVHEQDKFIEQFCEMKNFFVNTWGSIIKEDEKQEGESHDSPKNS